jgi:hypothetical protein
MKTDESGRERLVYGLLLLLPIDAGDVLGFLFIFYVLRVKTEERRKILVPFISNAFFLLFRFVFYSVACFFVLRAFVFHQPYEFERAVGSGVVSLLGKIPLWPLHCWQLDR